MNITARNLSITKGLIVPDNEAHVLFSGCCEKAETPGLHEMDLAARPHRWKEAKKVQVEFFNAALDKVTEYEVDILRILGLSNIEEVRAEYSQKETGARFEYTEAMAAELGIIFNEWRKDLLDKDGIYQTYQHRAFSVGAGKTFGLIKKRAPLEIAELLPSMELAPSLENDYLKAVIKNGTKRIKTRLAKTYLEELKTTLEYMARKGANPIEVARMVHGITGEGQAWYWLRIARSESALAIDAAYDAQSNAAGVRYDEWSAAPGACEICISFDGRVWERGRGPRPISDSHPHCLCLRMPLYVHKGAVMKPWDRPSPYKKPYTRDEVAELPMRFAA